MLKSVLLVTGHTARTSEAYLEAGQQDAVFTRTYLWPAELTPC